MLFAPFQRRCAVRACLARSWMRPCPPQGTFVCTRSGWMPAEQVNS